MTLFHWKFLAIFFISFMKPGSGQICSSDMTSCPEGRCIPRSHRCDGTIHCSNDEDSCDGGCAVNEYECQSGACIPLFTKCNRKLDCAHGDDENNCTNSEGCRYHQFQCFPSMECVSNPLKCEPNSCPAGDEQPVCDGQCGADEFSCGNGACVPLSYRCDYTRDCADGEDESGCDESDFITDQHNCTSHEVRCDGRCRTIDGVCNEDCFAYFPPVCLLVTCFPGEHRCRSGYCLPAKYVCDGYHDCFDFDDDEANCTGHQVHEPVRTCPYHTFQCPGDNLWVDGCVDSGLVCDTFPQCERAADETVCDGNCGPDEFRCYSRACISQFRVCDRRVDCATGEDEVDCPRNSEGCRYNEFQCKPSMQCLNYINLCQSFCPEGDEQPSCDGQCGPDQFRCENGDCIPQYLQCDGVRHCPQGHDENGCGEIGLDVDNCPVHQFNCSGSCNDINEACSNTICINNFEAECTGECEPGFYQCRSGYCLPQHYVCDGHHDCFDFDDDEANCTGQVQDVPDITTNCTSAGVSASIPGSYVRSLLPGAGDLLELVGDDLLPLVGCVAVKNNDTDQYNMLFPPGIGQCSANLNESETEIVVTYKVSLGVAAGSSPHIITRNGESAVVVFQCAYNRSGIATLNQPLLAMISHVEVDLGTTSSSFTMEMARYTSENFTTIESEQTITIGSPVYIGVKIDVEAGATLHLQGVDCVLTHMTLENQIDIGTVYPVIIGGCATTDPLDADGNVIYNVTDSRKFGFSFLGFRWTSVQDANQEIWVTCEMNICERTENNDCKIDCPGQIQPPLTGPMKRSIMDETNDATRKISIGPFVFAPELISDDQLACDKDELECSHMCGVDTTGGAYCICPGGYFLMKDGKTCLEANRGLETLMEVTLFSSLCLMMLTILILAVVMVMKMKGVKKIEM